MLDRITCQTARRTKDPRFDGRFFVAVTSTRIYCRPICPAPAPKEEHVQYYETAAAAAEAGFRPCLRCRPETAPGCPAWSGSSTTVRRALRLIDSGALEDGSVDALATRLGMTSRHLRRLFLEHLGATPIAVAQTRRVHFAKRLIDETRLSFTEIALASGFGSIRRFNAAFLELYGRSPMQIRALRRQPSAPEHSYRFRLHYRAPLEWDTLLAFLSARAIPGVEQVAGSTYRRAISTPDGWAAVQAEHREGAVELTVRCRDTKALIGVVDRARRVFDLSSDPAEIHSQLSTDPLLASFPPGLRIPGAWDGWELAVRAILGQQVTVKGARTLAGRLVQRFGVPIEGELPGITHLFPSPSQLLPADLQAIGLPKARAATLRDLAEAVAKGSIVLDGAADLETTKAELCRIRGIGSWTAEYIAMRALGDPDAFPASDLGLIRATGLSAAQIEKRSEPWRPWRAYAVIHLWTKE